MAELAEEIEEMRRTNLYTAEKLQYIKRTRTEFEYKIHGVSKNQKDFKEYIMFEKVLLKEIHGHNKRDKSILSERKSSIEYKILRRIKNLYEIALQRFSHDFSLCLSYFKFCKQSNYINAASVAVQNMIKNCSQNPEVWQVAAAWYAQDRNDPNTALTVLNKGLTIHKDSQLLYTEAIRLELSVVSEDTLQDDITKRVCKRVETYVNFISEHIKDCNYFIEILNMLETYGFTAPVQDLIIEKLLQNYSDREFVWHTLAQREMKKLESMSDEDIQLYGKHYTLGCFDKYKEGLGKVATSEKASLWSMYLDCLVDSQRESNGVAKNEKSDLLKAALEQASSEGYLPERYYMKWLELVTDNEALHILEKATAALPYSVDLWKLRLRYATMSDRKPKVDEIFKQGVDKLKDRALPLWLTYIRYCGLLSDDKLHDIYEEGIRGPLEVSEVLKPKYIEWLAFMEGIEAARNKYTELVNQKPYCKELHFTMCKLESTEFDHDYEAWRRVHELACNQFGQEDVDVWINHILFYLHFHKIDNVNDKVQQICSEAERTLSPLLISYFKEKYNKARSEH